MKNTDNLSFDREHIWHPYSSVVHPPCIHEVISADGVRLRLNDGREIIDGMSSWWSAIHGYNHPRLNQAVKNQVETVSHVMFGGLTHPPAVELARKLVDITAEPLQKVFFADSGSIAVEVAIKMAIQYWFAQGNNNKQRLLTLRNGYHGDTFGTMAVCDPDNGMHGMFEQVLAKHLFAASPSCINDDDYSDEDIAPFRQIISENHHEIAAVILEPIVQNAGGMRFYCPEYLRQVRALCDQYNVLLILDEIATNFGRTGTLFAYEQADICPDIICLGKSLTAGYMTLAATMCTNKVAQGIAADGSGVLMHGPTFMGNPLACSVACESIDLLLESDWQGQVKAIEQQLFDELLPYQDEGLVKDVRVKGAIGVVELHQPIDEQMSWLPEFIVDQGVWIRPFRNLIYIMPPYIISSDDLSQLTIAVGAIVKRLSS
ncbi:adenosylmethionine--8-amino-7-oxononanoate transaminase [Pseudomonadota bacterium]|nr:adenosylmethionine--8-amino-7-oxononanoate transaminase [Pseudomonadota bacterium]